MLGQNKLLHKCQIYCSLSIQNTSNFLLILCLISRERGCKKCLQRFWFESLSGKNKVFVFICHFVPAVSFIHCFFLVLCCSRIFLSSWNKNQPSPSSPQKKKKEKSNKIRSYLDQLIRAVGFSSHVFKLYVPNRQ